MRIAATVTTDVGGTAFSRFLDESNVMPEDRVIRRIALRGAAEEGVAVSEPISYPKSRSPPRGSIGIRWGGGGMTISW